MNNSNIIKLFVKRVLSGAITIDQVPEKIREDVREAIAAEGK